MTEVIIINGTGTNKKIPIKLVAHRDSDGNKLSCFLEKKIKAFISFSKSLVV